MPSNTRLVFCLALIAAQFSAHPVRAADAVPNMASIVFTGRWDLRAPQRAITVNSGSYLRANFSGTAVSAQFDLSLNQVPLPTIAWAIDEGAWQESEVAPVVKLAGALKAGPHTVWLMIRGIDEHQSRWTPPLVGSVTFLGLDLPPDGNMLPPLKSWVEPKLKLEFLGDSITEGVLVQAKGLGPGKTSWAWQSDALHSYACRTAMALNAAWRQVGFGATGLVRGGSGGAVGALDSFNYFYRDCPRDDWQPDVVVVNQGTNDRKMPPDQYLPLYLRYLGLIRQAYPKAKIVALRPFIGGQQASIREAVAEARAKGDEAIYYVDTAGWYAGPLHPLAAASVGIADKLAAALKSEVLSPPAAVATYQVVKNWAQLPPGVKWGLMTAVDIDSKGTIYTFQRSGGGKVMVFDASGKWLRTWGEGMFPSAHGLRVDAQDNVWITDRKLQQVLKFSPDGQLLLALGQKGVAGDNNSMEALNGPSDVVFAKNGDIFVSDGEGSNTRIVKFSPEGKWLKIWGTKGSGPGQLVVPHSIVMDSKGLLYVANRSNQRIEIFDQSGAYVGVMKAVGTPYGLFMTKDDVLYTTDGSAEKQDLTVIDLKTQQVLAHCGGLAGPHMLAVDASGAVYVAETQGTGIKKLVRTLAP